MTEKIFYKVLTLGFLAFIIGVLGGVFWPGAYSFRQVIGLFIVLFPAAVVFLFRSLNKNSTDSSIFSSSKFWFCCLFIIVAFLSGIGRYSLSLEHLYDGHISHFYSENFSESRVVEGRVTGPPVEEGDYVKMRITPDKIWFSPAMEKSEVVTGGDILMRIRTEYEHGVSGNYLKDNKIYGDRLRITGAVLKPPDRSNPYSWDYRNYLNVRGIYAGIWHSENIEVIEESAGNWLVSSVLSLREKMLPAFDFFEAERDYKVDKTEHFWRISGVSILILAATLSLLFNFFEVKSPVYVPVLIAVFIVYNIISGFKIHTTISALLAGLTLLVFAYTKRDIYKSAITGGLAGVVGILVYNPGLVLEILFLFPVITFFALVLLTKPLYRLLLKIKGLNFILFWTAVLLSLTFTIFSWDLFFTWYVFFPYVFLWSLIFWWSSNKEKFNYIAGGYGFQNLPVFVRYLICFQLIYQFAVIWPLGSHYYYQIPLSSVVLNFLMIPVAALGAILSVLAGVIVIIPVIGFGLAGLIGSLQYYLTIIYYELTGLVLMFFPNPHVRKIGSAQLVFIYLIFAVFVWRSEIGCFLKKIIEETKINRVVSRRKKISGFLVLVAGLFIVLAVDPYSPHGELKITVLDVGFGEAIAVQTPAGSNLLFNAGARKWDHHYPDKEGERYDYGEKIIAPFWLAQGIKRLNLLALQSVEPQRSGGLAYLTEHLNINRAVGPLPEGVRLNERRFIDALGGDAYHRAQRLEHFGEDYYGNWERWIKQVRKNNVPYENPVRGDVLYLEQNSLVDGPVEFKIQVLNPPARFDYLENQMGNQSLVFKIEYGDVSFLLPGDIKREAQEEMLNTIPELVESDVLVVPSNGLGESSYNPDFLAAVNPEYVVLSSSTQIEIKSHWLARSLRKNLQNYRNTIPRSKFFFTGEDNAIIFTTNGRNLEVNTFGDKPL